MYNRGNSIIYSLPNYTIWLDYSYMVFTTIYVLESIIKFLGLGWKKVV
jgi:hypothetical protein